MLTENITGMKRRRESSIIRFRRRLFSVQQNQRLPFEMQSIPNRDKSYSYISSWREADREQWNQARWFNGMDAAQTADENKTIVCGHWHASYGHSKYEHKGSEFGEDADFSPYYGPGIIAIDACTAFSGKVNCLVIEV